MHTSGSPASCVCDSIEWLLRTLVCYSLPEKCFISYCWHQMVLKHGFNRLNTYETTGIPESFAIHLVISAKMNDVQLLLKMKHDYTVLREEFLSRSQPIVESRPNLVDDLKNYYSNFASPRTLDRAKNLEALLRIFEKRDKLSCSNIKPLMYVQSRYIKDPALERLLRDYDNDVSKRPPLFCNIYDVPCNEQRCTSEEPIIHDADKITNIVLLEVSEKLGRCWKDVARFAGLQEHDIDEIDCSPLPLKEKALKALLRTRSIYGLQEWKSKLEQALEKTRRRDLREMMQRMWILKHQETKMGKK